MSGGRCPAFHQCHGAHTISSVAWVESASASFRARHESRDAEGAARVLERLERARERLAERFPRVPDELTVVIHDSTGDYSDAVRAFQRVGNLSRGEEDLRYYKAVSLYETGRYDDARKELACALPYIPLTEDVSRYRTKIEQAGQRASLH